MSKNEKDVVRHHIEWLRQMDLSGPFISVSVLSKSFPNGLDERDPDKVKQLREAYGEWCEEQQQVAVHQGWIRHVLMSLLAYPEELLGEGQSIPPGLEARMEIQGETLRPDMVLKGPQGGPPRLLISIYPPGQDLNTPVKEKTWTASPGTRMMELLHANNVLLGLVTNGEQWMVVYAPRGEATGFGSWYADLWMQEPLLLRSFHSLLGLGRFFGVAADNTIEALFQASAKDQHEVTDQLGYQVRRAVEVLVQAIDRADASAELLKDIPPKTVYDASLTVMMRLVFLFAAEEREMLLLGDSFYDTHYAASTLRESLREMADQVGEEVLERRCDAWCRLLATFRAVHGGVEHDAMRLPAYGGTLFDPDRYPFLEGRATGTRWQETMAKPLQINNRVVLHLLEALQLLRVKTYNDGTAEAQRLSFRALDIEQIGHVYEGLLDHTVKRATEPMLGLAGTKDKEPEISLSKLEALSQDKPAVAILDAAQIQQASHALAAETKENVITLPTHKREVRYGEPPTVLLNFLKEETGKSDKALTKALNNGYGIDDPRLLIACDQDMSLLSRIQPFAALLRKDSFDQFVVIPAGHLYVTRGSERRSTGTHYTPRTLTEPIVQHTLEPLVYIGPAEGKPQAEWQLKSAKEILDLKVCDMAMGSGAFLVQACRYLSERLVEAWELTEKAHPGQFVVTPDGTLSTGSPTERLMPRDPVERLAIARRAIADRCLYGVDINPMAVEMAKLSLWLITVQRNRPFNFLDHALKRGDSLLGVTRLDQIEKFTLRAKEGEAVEMPFAAMHLSRYVEEATAKRRLLESLPSDTPEQLQQKLRLHTEAEIATAKLRAIADMLITVELRGVTGTSYEEQRAQAAEQIQTMMKKDTDAGIDASDPKSELAHFVRKALQNHRTFHWAIEFPEVFESLDSKFGFSAIIGNPPFMGNKKITGIFGADYRDYLVVFIAHAKAGLADLCAYFLLRAHTLRHTGGTCGLIATDTIAQGDTREVGLDQICNRAVIYRAIQSQCWPGAANVVVAVVWSISRKWDGCFFINGKLAQGIDSLLKQPKTHAGNPKELQESKDWGFIGSVLLGTGFIISPEQAQKLKLHNKVNADVIKPYLGGEDLNQDPDCMSTRMAICFWDWPLNKETAPDNYTGPVASDYQDCLDIIRRLVKPERDKKKRDAYRINWWRFAEISKRAYEMTGGAQFVLIKARVSPIHALTFVASGQIYSEQTIIFKGDWNDFGLLQSSLHEAWAIEYSTTKGKTTIVYAPSACLITFPRPKNILDIEIISRKYFDCRRDYMLTYRVGLTDTYNVLHNPCKKSEGIARLRVLHIELDQAVAAAYGWTDLDLGHGFHETKQGVRYTISESARRIVLDRLLALNHQRYEEEVKAGLHQKGKVKPTKTKGSSKPKDSSDGKSQMEFDL